MRLFFNLFVESGLFAINALVANKLRTTLSLLGVTIGIFAIVAVFTMVDSMKKNLKDSVETLGENVIFIQKWPWTFGPGYPWWKYINRPVPNTTELNPIKQYCKSAVASSLVIDFKKTISYNNSRIENANIMTISHEYYLVRDFKISKGRYFNENESTAGKNVAIIGAEIANTLFNNLNPLDKTIKIAGKKVRVIGVFKKEGESMIGNSMDARIVIPVYFANSIISITNKHLDSKILVKAKDGISNAQLKDELTGLLRAIRKLKPREDNNFALNETSLLTGRIDFLMSFVSFAGNFIGLFSILVGGFGIANIMFVSVKERTKLIGIQKSLGAKNYFILFQFLFEAITLCIIGGLIGLLLLFIATLVIGFSFDMQLYFSLTNLTWGVSISIIIGLIAGILPAWSAAKLDPVDAIRAN